MSLFICEVSSNYTNYLRQFDSRVSMEHVDAGNRKFIGVVLSIDGINYFAPMSSPKPKHLTMSNQMPDVYKIAGGKYGVINLNNMIPVPSIYIVKVKPEEVADDRYKILLQKQIRLIKKDEETIVKKAQKLYKIVTRNSNERLAARCCDFRLLEEKCKAKK